jgi:hypothetical protein
LKYLNKQKPLVVATRGIVLPGETGTRSGSGIVTRDGRLVKGGFLGCGCLCRGLLHAQEKQPGLVHPDSKPDNILVAQERLTKITDFDLAKVE